MLAANATMNAVIRSLIIQPHGSEFSAHQGTLIFWPSPSCKVARIRHMPSNWMLSGWRGCRRS
jgi:hypothetical protein